MTSSLVLEARGVGVAWAASAPIFTDASFVLERGFTGLVGANGSGKTTLLGVLAKEITPQDGLVRLSPGSAVVAYCPQAVEHLGGDVEELARRDDGIAAELRGRLALDDAELLRWPTLSPGERKRWQIAAALAREPDVLLLDEPTNHLDADARKRLIGALGRFRGIGVIVSHDRALLEKLPTTILRVHGGKVTAYAGSYSAARAAWEQERATAVEAHARAKDRVHHVEERLGTARRVQQSAVQGTSTRSRMKGPRDHDARGMLAKGRAIAAEARHGRNVTVVRDELERARSAVPTIEKDRVIGANVFATYERAPKPTLFFVDEAEVRRGERVILEDVRLTIGREDRVRVTGANGAGKTTLLHALLASQDPARVLYLAQEMAHEEMESLVRKVALLPAEERGRILSLFAALGSDPERIARRNEGILSPGEARKLALAFGLGGHAWALVLDEPTNHLDLPTIERLERALDAYPGCIVMVTHDDAFARATTRRELRVEGGRVM